MMREILFLAHRIPWPPDRGDKIRSHHMLRALAEHAPVHVGAFADDEGDMGWAGAVRGLAASAHIERRTKPNWRAGLEALTHRTPVSLKAFESPAMDEWVARTIRDRPIDLIVVFSGQMAQYLPAHFGGRVVIDFVDVDSAKFESYGREGRGPMAWINAREGRLLAEFEAAMAKGADASLLVSEAEAALFARRTGAQGIYALGNGIDLFNFSPTAPIEKLPPHSGPLIVFTGQMDYRPNVEAVTAFTREAMPLILRRHADARFAIVGRAPTPAVRALESDHVRVTGAVDDVRPWLAAAEVVVAPLGIARGVQNKVLEAMSMARPVVVSAAALEGIDAVPGQHLLAAPTLAGQAQHVVDLLADPVRRDTLGRAARAQVEVHYRWDQRLAPLAGYCGLTGDPAEVAA